MKNITALKSIHPSAAFTTVNMRRYIAWMVTFLIFQGYIVTGQVGVHTDFPDASSAMEIYATDKGLLIPRVVLTNDLTNPSPVSAPANGLLVFNNGANQPEGFYYWDGSQWVAIGGGGSGSTDFWSLFGNAGTSAGNNFLGTTDYEDLLVYTNNAERMRFEPDGQVLIGRTTPYYGSDLVTIQGNAVQNYALSVYSPNVGVYSFSTYSSFFAENGRYGLVALVDTATGFGVYSKNYHPSGHGMITAGANAPAFSLTDHVVGIASSGNHGVFARANSSTGNGIIALGNALDTASTISAGCGAAFTGYNGVYAIGVQNNGVGMIGIGNNSSSYSITPDGCGGTFTGFHGLYGYANGSSGIGITALGGGATTYFNFASGLGGTFTGYHGIISLGNNDTDGTGVIGVGNNQPYTTTATGSGGAFVGYECGVFGYATRSNQQRYGGYFATAGGLYAYVGGRYSNTNRKIVGTGTVSTIVKNTQGERITLTCPEAPETLFMDFGTGQLINGRVHIEIDPDLAINILVNEEHPLKVFITPEGDCNGVYVTNKSNTGFDVVELMGGESNVSFSWQIVATRANEEYVLEDGSTEISIYTERFPPAPEPMELSDNGDVKMEKVEMRPINKYSVEKVDEMEPASKKRK